MVEFQADVSGQGSEVFPSPSQGRCPLGSGWSCTLGEGQVRVSQDAHTLEGRQDTASPGRTGVGSLTEGTSLAKAMESVGHSSGQKQLILGLSLGFHRMLQMGPAALKAVDTVVMIAARRTTWGNAEDAQRALLSLGHLGLGPRWPTMAYGPRGQPLPTPTSAPTPFRLPRLHLRTTVGRSFSNCVVDSFLPQLPAPETRFPNLTPPHGRWTGPYLTALSCVYGEQLYEPVRQGWLDLGSGVGRAFRGEGTPGIRVCKQICRRLIVQPSWSKGGLRSSVRVSGVGRREPQ